MRGLVALMVILGPSMAFAGYIKFHKTGFVREDIKTLEGQLQWYVNQGDYQVTLDLDSGGGDLSGILGLQAFEQGLAYRMKNLKSKGLVLTTQVSSRSVCESACTALFALGDRRLAWRSSNFMFHAVIVQKAGKKKKYYKKLYADRWYRVINEVDSSLAKFLKDNGWLETKRHDWDIRASSLKSKFGNYITEIL